MTPDHINAGFEIAAALIVWLNVRQVLRDRKVHGVHWAPILLFSVWGVWNAWYYPSLGQTWSGAAAVFVALANTTWLIYVLAYWPHRRRPISADEARRRDFAGELYFQFPARMPAVFRSRREPLNINSGADRP